jgi:ATP-binding cassette subfamily B (MDR/TAP) protein 1
MMAPGIQAINLARQAAVDIFDTIKRSPEIDASTKDGIELDGYDGNIEMKSVAFAYPSHPDRLIFKNINLRIEKGSSVALVGPSGSGKSTITKLLLRFYDPVACAVLADGVSLRDLNLKWWRSKIGYVPQQPHLFIGSIRDNIAAGKSSEDKPATDEEVFAAARAACADEFIRNLPDGYDTFYSGASIQMSGGQIQRIAIARAIVRDPVILLLDEATSALDSASEKSVQDALANIRKNKKLTTITVAHRLSTIISSDQIAVISDGEIAELGTHASLIDEGGIYANLCESQGITKESLKGESSEGSSLVVGSVSADRNASLKPTSNPDDIESGMRPSDNVEKSMVNSEEEEEALELSGTRKRLWQYNKPEWCYIVIGVIGAMVTGVLHPSEGKKRHGAVPGDRSLTPFV